MLVVCTQCEETALKMNDVVYADLHTVDTYSEIGVSLKCTILDLQKRLDYLMYDTVEKMADGKGSGIELIDKKQLSCITCSR